MLTGPGGSGSTTSEDDCPLYDDAERVVYYGTVDPEAEPIVLVQERRSVQPEQPTEFTLKNRSQQQFNTNFYAWRLHKCVDGDWYHVAPQGWPKPLTPLEAGEQHTWTLTVTTGPGQRRRTRRDRAGDRGTHRRRARWRSLRVRD